MAEIYSRDVNIFDTILGEAHSESNKALQDKSLFPQTTKIENESSFVHVKLILGGIENRESRNCLVNHHTHKCSEIFQSFHGLSGYIQTFHTLGPSSAT
jgi:hypothetical protein